MSFLILKSCSEEKKMPKAIIRVLELKPSQIKARVFIKFREEGKEPLEREMLFKVKNRVIYDKIFDNLNSFFKVGVSYGEVFNVYDMDENIDRLRRVNNFVL